MKSLLAIVLTFAASVHADNYQVNVGQGGLTYNPNTVSADMGDTIEFIFDGVSRHLHFNSFLDT
jgi:plastocyanin